MNRMSTIGISAAHALNSLMGMYSQPKSAKRNKKKVKIAKASKKRNR